MTTWRDRSIGDTPLSASTKAILKAAWLETLGEIVDRSAVAGIPAPELTTGQRMRICAVIAECRDEDIRRRFPPFGAAA